MKRTPLRRTPWRRKKRDEAEAEAMVAWWHDVMDRGRWTCALGGRWCTIEGLEMRMGPCLGRLHAHHVAPRSTHPHRRHDPDNGAVLCQAHHQWVHEHPALAELLGLLERATT